MSNLIPAAEPLLEELLSRQVDDPVKHKIIRSQATRVANWYAMYRPGQPFNDADRDDYIAQGGPEKTRKNEWLLVRTYLRGGQPAYDTKTKRAARSSMLDAFAGSAYGRPSLRPEPHERHMAALGAKPTPKITPQMLMSTPEYEAALAQMKDSVAEGIASAEGEWYSAEQISVQFTDALLKGLLGLMTELHNMTKLQHDSLTQFLTRLAAAKPGVLPVTEAEALPLASVMASLPVTTPEHREAIRLAVDYLTALSGATKPTSPASNIVSTYEKRCKHLVEVMRGIKANFRFARPERRAAVDHIIELLRNPHHDRNTLADRLIELDASLYSITAVHRTAIVRMVDSIRPDSGIARDLAPNDRYDTIRGGKSEWPDCVPLDPRLREAFQYISGRAHWVDFVYACAWSGIGPNGTLYDFKREETLEAMSCIWDLSEQEKRVSQGHFMGGLHMGGQLPAAFAERIGSGRWGFPELHKVLWLLRYSVCKHHVTEFTNMTNPKGEFPDWSGLRPDGGDGISVKDWLTHYDANLKKANPEAYRAQLKPEAQLHYDRCFERFSQLYQSPSIFKPERPK